MKREDHFPSSDKKSTIWYTEWIPDEKPKAVLQIIHGMSEYIDRYNDFAEYLNSNGFVVAGTDHIGHGRSADPADYGYMGEKDGWKRMADDEEIMHHILKDKYPDIPVHVMGHSMGSFIIRTWLSKHGKNSGKFIIMGTAGSNPALGAGLALTRLIRMIKGGHGRSGLITAIAFGSYNKRIPNAKTLSDWLTQDEDKVQEYIKDDRAGFTFTLAGYTDLFEMLRFINTDTWYRMVPKTHPILVTAGLEDPVGDYGKGPTEVYTKLREAGCMNASIKLYDSMRHEILNEIGKEKVYEDILEFLN